VLEQATLARFIATGELDRHLRGLRRLYGRRARALSAVFARELPEFALHTPTSGFHALLHLGPDHDEDVVVRSVAAHGIRVFGLGAHVLHGPPAARIGVRLCGVAGRGNARRGGRNA
jgi:GntR family transcriptional regulator/MocR family aminotransferase